MSRPVMFNGGDGGAATAPNGTSLTSSLLEGSPSWLVVVADPIRLHILRSLSEVVEATASNLAEWGPTSNQTLRRHLEALVSYGMIEERPGESDGQTAGRPASRFSLAPEVRESVRSVLDFIG